MPAQQSDVISVPLTMPEDGQSVGIYPWYESDK
jgi:hypothetical protein